MKKATQFRTLLVVTLGALLLLAAACGRSKRNQPGRDSGGDEPGGAAGDSSHERAGAMNGGGGSGGDASGVSGAAGAGGEDDPLSLPECSLDPLTGDSEYTWDAAVVALRVNLSLNGASFPDSRASEGRGTILLRNRRTMTVQILTVAATGSASAEGLAFAGRYDVFFSVLGDDTIPGLRSGTPTRLATDLEIAKDGAFDFELETLRLDAVVTVNGEPMPDSPDAELRGQVELRDPEAGASYSADIGASGEARFDVVLFAGSYDVTFQSSNASLVALPYAAATRIHDGVYYDHDQSVTFDLTPVVVKVSLTSDTGPLPDSEDSFRGHLVFRDELTNTQYRFDVGASGPTAIEAGLFAGAYEISFAGGGELPSSFPRSGLSLLAPFQRIFGGEELHYDLTPLPVSGTITLNGERMPDNPDGLPRGSVSFRDFETGKVYDFSVGASGDALYSGVVFAGTYDVSFKTNLVHQPGLPFGGNPRFRSRVLLDSDGSRDYDLSVVEVAGTVTSHGGDLPDSAGATTRGVVTFHDPPTGSSVQFDVGATGPASFSGLVYAGSYDVTFDSSMDELVGLPSGASTRVADHMALTHDETLDFDVRPIEVRGSVTVNGARMPDSPGAETRGAVALRDKFTNVTHELELGGNGAAEFSALVFDGAYDAALVTASDTLTGLPVGATTLLATGCLELGPCTRDTGDLSGHWTFVFDLAGWGPLSIEMEEGADRSLSGRFVTPTDSGYFESGYGNDNGFTLTADLGVRSCAPLTLRAHLESACGATGFATCGGFSEYSPFFTAYR